MDTSSQTTQQFRDVLQQSDHDALVELRVLMQTMLAETKLVKDQLKDMAISQAASIATLESKVAIITDGLEGRIRKLEDSALQYIPSIVEMQATVKANKASIEKLEDSKTLFLGGWRMLGILVGAIMGFASFIYLTFSIFGFHPSLSGR